MIVAAAATKIILICHSQIHFEYSKINDTRADIFFSIALAVFIVWILCRSDFTTHKVICPCCIYDKCTMNITCIGNPIEVSLLVLEVELVNCVASMQYQQKKKDLQKSTDCKCIIKKRIIINRKRIASLWMKSLHQQRKHHNQQLCPLL